MDWGANGLNAGLEIDSPSIRMTIRRIANEMISPGFAHAALCEALLIQAAIDVARYCRERANHTWEGGLSPHRLRIIDERAARIGPPPQLGELAQACNLSVRQLTRGFRVSRNCSIGEFIAHSRIENAKNLLANGASVNEIASLLGYSSTGNFSTSFRRATGETPRGYRSGSSCFQLAAN